MVLDDKTPQMLTKVERPTGGEGEAFPTHRRGEASPADHGHVRSGARGLMERVLARENLLAALKRVEKKKGSGGIDGMTTEGMRAFLVDAWPRIREELLSGRYQPSPVRRVEILKDGGGTRELGIPTVVDRFIQQALLQVLQALFDPTFSDSSYGYRPGRSAHQAVLAAKRFVQQGRRIVVDLDLEKFFDRVNHDVLMGRLAKRIDDKRVLTLIRRFLEAGVMMNGVVHERAEGTPQGGPLSPLLANFLLDEVDKELEARDHLFVRYADDCTVYVRSRRAGERVLQVLRRLYGRLRLRINEAKTAVAHVTTRKLLGFSFQISPRGRSLKIRIADKAIVKFKDTIRTLTGRNRGRSLTLVVEELRAYLRGWKAYFRLAETPQVFEQLDGWIRTRLRVLLLKQWKRATTAFSSAKRMGASPLLAKRLAARLPCWWEAATSRFAGFVITNRFFDELGLVRLAA
jgi:RNA-directed DNA polymerase